MRVHQQTVDRATQMSACHAGGRGFESRRSRHFCFEQRERNEKIAIMFAWAWERRSTAKGEKFHVLAEEVSRRWVVDVRLVRHTFQVTNPNKEEAAAALQFRISSESRSAVRYAAIASPASK